MVFRIGHVDLSKVELTPAYDLQADGKFIAFRTPGIPWCRFALEAMVIVVYGHTYEAHLYSPHNEEVRYVFNVQPWEYERLLTNYVEGHHNV